MTGRLFRSFFGIELQTLAVFRIVIAGLFALDILRRLPNLTAFYTDHGVLPRGAVMHHLLSSSSASLYFINGSQPFALMLFGLSLAAAVSLFVGYKTRHSTLACWILALSLHNRNPLVTNGGDSLLQLLLFWSLFIPLGGTLSVDSRKFARPAAANSVILSMGTVGILLQVALHYVFAGFLKRSPEWNESHSAVANALGLLEYGNNFGRWLLQYPELLKWLTVLTIKLERYGPLLFFMPMGLRYCRCLGVCLFTALHVAILSTLNLGLFPFINLAALILFWPLRQKSAVCHYQIMIGPRYRLANGLALAALILVVNSNLTEFVETPWQRITRVITDATGLEQNWHLFSESEMRTLTGWYSIPGLLKDGTQINLICKGRPHCDPMKSFIPFEDTQWRHYLMTIRQSENENLRDYYGRYLCRQWNARCIDSKMLVEFEIDSIETLPLDRAIASLPSRRPLWYHRCF